MERLQQEGRKVCFVGDGINDAIALKQADLSVSLRGASTAATDTAQVVLMDARLQGLVSNPRLKLLGFTLVCRRVGIRVVWRTYGHPAGNIPGSDHICVASEPTACANK